MDNITDKLILTFEVLKGDLLRLEISYDDRCKHTHRNFFYGSHLLPYDIGLSLMNKAVKLIEETVVFKVVDDKHYLEGYEQGFTDGHEEGNRR